MLKEIENTKTSKIQNQLLEIALFSADSLLQIINDILDYSKIEAGKLEIAPRQCNLIELIDPLIKSHAITANQKQLVLFVENYELNVYDVIADDLRIKQIITNLLNNAIKFTHSGHVKVSYSSKLIDNKVNFTCSVEDTGIGIDTGSQGKIFSDFSQEDSTTTRQFGGTGLGLSICKKLCESMGGEIGFESEKNKGSKFFFNLNLEAQEEQVNKTEIYRDLLVVLIDFEQKQLPYLEKIFKKLDIQFERHESFMSLESIADAVQANVKKVLFISSTKEVYELVLNNYRCISGFKRKFSCQLSIIKNFSLENSKAQNEAFYQVTKRVASSFLGEPNIVMLPFLELDLMHAVLKNKTVKSSKDFPRGKQNEDLEVKIEKSSQKKPFEGRHFLVAEDNRVNQIVISRILEKLGGKVTLVSNGEELILLLKKNAEIAFDLILMDCNMPKMDGFVAAKKITEGECGDRVSKIPIVAVTANAFAGDIEKSRKAGMLAHISKPIDIDTLRKKILDVL